MFNVRIRFLRHEKKKMENLRRSSSMAILGIFCIFRISFCKAIETPEFKVIHSESEFEIRLYTQSTWMSASIPHLSFAKATRNGYHRLFQFIEGANLNASRIPMTIPVLTTMVPKSGEALHSSTANSVKFYLPEKFQSDPPTPMPQLNLKPQSLDSQCLAVRKFPGFARDWNIGKEAEKLFASLRRTQWEISTSSETGFAYSVAQYSSPFKFTGRLNEVWISIDGYGSEGCVSSKIASH